MASCITIKHAVMKPEIILQSDVLDIIFDGRNKEYGAYALRKNYNHRLIKALGITFLAAALFLFLQNMQVAKQTAAPESLIKDLKIVEVAVPKDKIDPKPKQDKPKATQQPKKTILNVVPIIKPDDQVAATTVHTQDDLDKTNFGSKPVDGVDGDPGNIITPPSGDDVPAATVNVEPETKGPVDWAEIMPSFNGDIIKYMLRHLRQPDDLEEGERIVVRIKFIVNEEGNISDVQVIQSGRPDLDEQVVRVVKKMPRWNPGKQAGKAVPVYFNMPVTFVSNP